MIKTFSFLFSLTIRDALKMIDNRDYENINSYNGRQLTMIPLLRRKGRSKKRERDSQIIIDGNLVCASQPKKARRS